jgi:hypothetical protein
MVQRTMGLLSIAAHARERLGMEIQAISRVGHGERGRDAPRVWEVMTEHGYFWLVEWADEVELFRAALTARSRAQAGPRVSPTEAARRFMELHPRVG